MRFVYTGLLILCLVFCVTIDLYSLTVGFDSRGLPWFMYIIAPAAFFLQIVIVWTIISLLVFPGKHENKNIYI